MINFEVEPNGYGKEFYTNPKFSFTFDLEEKDRISSSVFMLVSCSKACSLEVKVDLSLNQ